jgi:hypothetical protein
MKTKSSSTTWVIGGLVTAIGGLLYVATRPPKFKVVRVDNENFSVTIRFAGLEKTYSLSDQFIDNLAGESKTHTVHIERIYFGDAVPRLIGLVFLLINDKTKKVIQAEKFEFDVW